MSEQKKDRISQIQQPPFNPTCLCQVLWTIFDLIVHLENDFIWAEFVFFFIARYSIGINNDVMTTKDAVGFVSILQEKANRRIACPSEKDGIEGAVAFKVVHFGRIYGLAREGAWVA